MNMGKHVGGKSFRAHHKSQANMTRNKRGRLFDEFRKDFLVVDEYHEYANDNTTRPYKEEIKNG